MLNFSANDSELEGLKAGVYRLSDYNKVAGVLDNHNAAAP